MARPGALVLLAMLAIAACYAPSPSPGAPCGPGGACPAELTCSAANLCVAEGTPADGAVFDDGSSDAGRVRWQVIDTAGRSSTVLPVTRTQPGSTLIVAVETGASGTIDGVLDDANNSYQLIPGSQATNLGRNSIELWIANQASPATGLIAMGTGIIAVVMWEVANLATDPVVAAATLDNQPPILEPVGAPVTTTERGQLAISVVIVEDLLDGILPGAFTADETTRGNGWAHLTDDDAPPGTYQARWTQAVAGTSCATSVVLR